MEDCEGHQEKIVAVKDFTSGNDFIVKLACGHEATIDHAGWIEFEGSKGPQLIVEETHCMDCEAACPACS